VPSGSLAGIHAVEYPQMHLSEFHMIFLQGQRFAVSRLWHVSPDQVFDDSHGFDWLSARVPFSERVNVLRQVELM